MKRNKWPVRQFQYKKKQKIRVTPESAGKTIQIGRGESSRRSCWRGRLNNILATRYVYYIPSFLLLQLKFQPLNQISAFVLCFSQCNGRKPIRREIVFKGLRDEVPSSSSTSAVLPPVSCDVKCIIYGKTKKLSATHTTEQTHFLSRAVCVCLSCQNFSLRIEVVK
jgi:hypothetical protein